MKKRGILLTVLATVVVAGSVGAYYYNTLRTHTQTEPTQATTTPTEPKKITLTLPNADPIDALIEDYNLPSSQWVVVNKDLPLTDQHYRPSDLTELTSVQTRSEKTTDERSLRAIVIDDVNALFSAGATAGYKFMIGSAFRSYELQTFYYNNYVATSGEAAANKFSAKPGQSEHQTGLSFDISLTSKECYLDTCFGDLAAGKWIAAHAATYGFIVRYPIDKVEITQYQYEPWHLRYVGKELATALNQSGLTLDEAHPYLQKVRTELVTARKISE